MKKLLLIVCGILLISFAQAQRKVVIIGSSTAEGEIGTSSLAASFVERLKAYYPTHTFINLALRGTNTYNALAASVPGKPSILPDRNITAALSYNPDIILVAYPTNDVAAGYTNQETLDNLQSIVSTASAAGKFIYVIGTQPRDFVNPDLRTQLATQNDLVLQTFPTTSINVYPDLVRTGGYRAFEVAFPDDLIHINDEGHRRMFQKVVDFNIFQSALPVSLTKFNAEMMGSIVNLSWETSAEVNNDRFIIERSSDGNAFRPIGTVKGKGSTNTSTAYKFSDATPLAGANYYRLAQVDVNGRTAYSRTMIIRNQARSSVSAYPVPAFDVVTITTTQSSRTLLNITVVDARGAVVYSAAKQAQPGNNAYRIPVDNWRSGSYFVRISSTSGTESFSFIKQ